MAPVAIDASLDQRIHSALTNSPYFLRQRPEVQTDAGKVVLRGTVPSYYHKQMAQEALRRVDGIEHIENQLIVHSSF